MRASTATEGSQQTESLVDIWRRAGAFSRNRQFTLDNLKGFCRRCVHAETCRGGCVSMRTCEGGRRFHSIITAWRRWQSAKWIGRGRDTFPCRSHRQRCLQRSGAGGAVSEENVICAEPHPHDDAAVSETGSDALPEQGEVLHGLFDATPQDAPTEIAPYYGLPTDAPPKDADAMEASTWYGVDPPDADASRDAVGVVSFYAIPPPQEQ
jgi:radical SAM protein with 4Fe4S-binding SPASM domain